LIAILLVCILVITGCDTDSEKSVTGDYVDREPRGLKTLAVPADSISVAHHFRKELGYSTNALAGRYENSEAFAVFKFSLRNVRIDSLIGATLKIDIDDLWGDGEIGLDLFETHSDWSDTMMVNPDIFLHDLALPLAAISADTSQVDDDISFDIDPAVITAWLDKGSVLVKSSDTGTIMAGLLTADTSYPPILKLIEVTIDGDIDTTNVKCSEGTYFFDTGIESDKPVLSEGDGSGFVLYIGLPETLPNLAAVNRCVLRMSALERMIADNSMMIKVYRLNEAFTTIDEADTDTASSVLLEILPDQETYEIDITPFINRWHVGGDSNYGLLIEPMNETDSPNQCVFIPADSLIITYTPFPEIK